MKQKHRHVDVGRSITVERGAYRACCRSNPAAAYGALYGAPAAVGTS
jgi:hypothetical protein